VPQSTAAGLPPGEPAGDPAGDPAGEPAGDAAGDVAVVALGVPVAAAPGDPAGDPAAVLPGDGEPPPPPAQAPIVNARMLIKTSHRLAIGDFLLVCAHGLRRALSITDYRSTLSAIPYRVKRSLALHLAGA